jgi:hypothetical protein
MSSRWILTQHTRLFDRVARFRELRPEPTAERHEMIPQINTRPYAAEECRDSTQFFETLDGEGFP